MSRILIAEDEARITSFIRKGLEANGFSTEVVADGLSAVDVARKGGCDLVVLDIGLPGLDGFGVLRRIREAGITIPVIVLTARDSIEDTVAGLSGGADDYMHKPFAFEELLARIRLRLRAEPEGEIGMLEVGDLQLDLRTRRVSVDGVTAELTTREFTLLEMFMRHPEAVLSREQLLSRVWGLDFDPGSNVVDVYVRYLRGKIGDGRVETVRGAGYRLRA